MLVVWSTLSATAYVISTVGMKYWDILPKFFSITLIAGMLAIAVYFEILALRQAELAITLILIIGLEAVIALLLGSLVLGESYSFGNLTGTALVIAGVIMINTTQASA